MRNMKVSAKLIVSFLIIGSLAVAVGAVGIFGMMRIADSGAYKSENIIDPMSNLAGTERTLLVIRIHVREMVMAAMTGDFGLVEEEFANIAGLLPVLDDYMAAYRAMTRNPEAMRLFDEARAMYENDLVPVVVSIYAASQVADIPAILAAMELCRHYSDIILDKFESCFRIMQNEAQTASGNATSLSRTLLVAIVAALGFALVATIFLTVYVSGMIGGPIRLLTSAFADVADGDLTKKLPDEGGDEIASASRSFNKTMHELRAMVLSIKKQSGRMSEIGGDLAGDMAKTAVAMGEITANIKNVQGRIMNQSASVSETHATMEQVVSNINRLNGHIESQSSDVANASSAIEQMVANTKLVTETLAKNDKNVKTLMEASEAGRADLQDVAADIQEISRESEGLLEINSVMEAISGQTNLLSMNAAIEAAHAGDSGRGFAVVADEIRKLAESAGEQSKTIGDVLKKMKDSIVKITGSTENVLNRFEAIDASVRTVVEQEANIRAAMNEQGAGSRRVLDGMGRVNEITRQVSIGSREMLEGARGVIKESSNLEKLTQDITLGMGAMASGVEQVNASVHRVNGISDNNREGIDSLTREVSRFKVH